MFLKREGQTTGPGNQDNPAPQKKRCNILLLNIVAMLIVTAALFTSAIFGLDIYTRHGQEVRMPDLRGLSEQAADKKLQLLGLQARIDDSVYVKTLPAGVIYEQTIVAGERVKTGRTIGLVINSGNAPQLVLPDIADNSSLREAIASLSALGFRLGPTEYINGEKDWVYEVKCNGHNVGAGSRIDSDDEIILVAGDGVSYGNDIDMTDSEYAIDSLQAETGLTDVPPAE